VIARRAVWSSAKVRAILARFVLAADEVGYLQRVKGPEGELFRKIAEQGHYAGRSQPTNTRQGLYAATVDGRLLASINHNDPDRVAAMLERAWDAWQALGEKERVPEAGWDGVAGKERLERHYPADGLTLRVTSRDLPRAEPPADDWRAKAWNLDFAWLRAGEVASLVPEGTKAGTAREWPAPLADRIVRLHLVDNVRGQTHPAEPADLTRARLTSTVSGADGHLVRLDLEGEGRWQAKGRWVVEGLGGEPHEHVRGVEARLLGSATWDARAQKMTAFELVAVGLRWGASRYNGRHGDLAPAPIGWLFELAGDAPADRVAPASIWSYGWR
jgi:hypothetical protein